MIDTKKRKVRFYFVLLILLFLFLFIACDNGTTHIHEWGEWEITTAPTCTAAGVETGTCAADGAISTRPIAALGHNWGAWVWTTALSSSTDGEKERTCARDNSHKETHDILRTDYPNLVIDIVGGEGRVGLSPNVSGHVIIPEGVTNISSAAFSGCTNLEIVTCHPTAPPTLGTDAFTNTPASLAIKVPPASVAAYQGAAN